MVPLSPLIQSSLLPLPTLVLPKPRAAHGGSAPAPDSSTFSSEKGSLLLDLLHCLSESEDRIFH